MCFNSVEKTSINMFHYEPMNSSYCTSKGEKNNLHKSNAQLPKSQNGIKKIKGESVAKCKACLGKNISIILSTKKMIEILEWNSVAWVATNRFLFIGPMEISTLNSISVMVLAKINVRKKNVINVRKKKAVKGQKYYISEGLALQSIATDIVDNKSKKVSVSKMLM